MAQATIQPPGNWDPEPFLSEDAAPPRVDGSGLVPYLAALGTYSVLNICTYHPEILQVELPEVYRVGEYNVDDKYPGNQVH